MTLRQRYPGAQPFSPAEERIFFGRDDDLVKLKRKIKLAPLTVLYGKSGLGKSSLVNAGLLPKLKEEEEAKVVKIRFGAAQSKTSTSASAPAKACAASIQANTSVDAAFLEQLVAKDESIWRQVKDFSVQPEDEQELLLVFDQFEELFTYSEAEIAAFKQQLAEALYTSVPQRYWDALEENYERGTASIGKEDTLRLQGENRLKVLLVIRSDRMHLLEKLSDFLPAILRNCQELEPLDISQAKEAIVAPALLDGNFASPAFTYAQDAISDMLGFLTDFGTAPIESTQLQIICQHLEEQMVKAELTTINTRETADLPAIIEQYYDGRIAEINLPTEQLAARKLVEDGFIFVEEERRLSLYEGQILKKISAETLRILVDGHLLRAEPSIRGGYTYELSHDTLVPPILKARGERIARETKAQQAEDERQKKQELRGERKKRYLAYSLAGLFLLLALFAMYQNQAANRARLEAEERAFDLQLERIEQLKLEGKYPEAIGGLEELQSSAIKFESDKNIQILLDNYRRIGDLVVAGLAAIAENDYGKGIAAFENAYALSPDTNLGQLLEKTRADKTALVRKKKNDFIGFLNANSRFADSVAVDLRLLDAELEVWVDSVRAGY